MAKKLRWETALKQALKTERALQTKIGLVARLLYEMKAYKLADVLNSELRSLAFSSAAAFHLHEPLMNRIERHLDTDDIRRLTYPFVTDAVISAYNAQRIVRENSIQDSDSELSKRLSEAFDRHLPRLREAADAIRHHHDRAFGKVRLARFPDKSQRVATFGSSVRLVDEKFLEFWFDFPPEAVEALLEDMTNILKSPCV